LFRSIFYFITLESEAA